ncbi:cold-shock protein [Stenotrophomonas maltophilia]|nr:cold-shock protein [Stenotrophomonas maltophilia]HBP03341.1 cold-shock protein [Stenotrophomonas sp.]ELN2591726.1 cold-shock protein [Stenotrophomonas maltophilia]MBA0298215.1 cold-shock protein [Stenotrophomonas maltophilia]MBH1399823.1 cold-shock protein [Stenotrophomonas maltophilia]
MKMHGLAAAAVCIAVIGAMWVEWPEPAGDQVWAYQKLQPADYRLLHSDALGFVTAKAHEGFELHARHARATSFEIRCKGVVVMDVENAPSRVLIRMPADARWRAPDIERLRISFERWLDLHQSQGRLLVESAGPSWVEARLGRLDRSVPDDQRCVFRDPGHPRLESPSSFRLSSRPLQAVEGMAASSSALFRNPKRAA